MGRLWYLIVSTPDLCTLTYLVTQLATYLLNKTVAHSALVNLKWRLAKTTIVLLCLACIIGTLRFLWEHERTIFKRLRPGYADSVPCSHCVAGRKWLSKVIY